MPIHNCGTVTPKRAQSSRTARITQFIVAILCLFSSVAQAQVPVSISPAPRLQFLDSNGHPLAGGCVFTYQAGTSTPLATYIDSGGVFQNTNPVILDAGGFASIWLAAQAYDIAVYSTGGVNCATGAQQYKTLNINGNTALLNNANVWSGLQTFNGGLTGPGSLGTLTAGPGILATQNTWTANQNFSTLTSTTANPSLVGSLRLANTDIIGWRNSANTADLNFHPQTAVGNLPTDTMGGSFAGITSSFFAATASSTNVAASGGFRLNAADSLCWRNQANSGDVCITKNATDNIVAPGLSGYKTECVNTTPVTVGNTVTPTSLQTCTIPANDIAAASTFYVDAQGIIGGTGTPPTITINVMLDGVVLSSWLPTLAAANTQPWAARITFTGISTGVSGQVTGAPMIWQSSPSGGGPASGNIASNTTGVGAPPQFVTVNTTVSHVITIQVTWGAANALNTITSNTMTVYRVN